MFIFFLTQPLHKITLTFHIFDSTLYNIMHNQLIHTQKSRLNVVQNV